MSANLEAKKAVVAQIEEKIEKAQSITIVEYKALTVEAITALRAKCRAAGVDYCVLKNTMVRRAMANKGIELDKSLLEGSNAYIFSNNDPISGPKLVKEFISAAEKDKKVSALTIKGGYMDGAAQSVEDIKALADILPREQLIAKIMGALNSQATALALVIKAIAEKKAEGAAQE
ncbi:MAG: 50S ribosomal protein L10 [Clostridiales bacterium]|nr:50S ribosomal protein L10 [Clostridiales bacterium]